ncbi:MAG: 6,7-dimethyl-8-ribityllumazine synthase, partial [Gammaproteobacteria bacterium]
MLKDINIAIVLSVFNSEVTEQLLDGALSRLIESGMHQDQINVVKVPGAIEIPLTTKLLAMSKKYHAIICLGAVIRGETNHYEYVCQQVSQGCQQVMLEFNIPVIFGVLTTKNLKQAKDRVCKFKEHKGIEAADTAISMIKMVKGI